MRSIPTVRSLHPCLVGSDRGLGLAGLMLVAWGSWGVWTAPAFTSSLEASGAGVQSGVAQTRPDESPSAYTQALALYRAGRFDQAVQILEGALKSSPNDPVGYFSLLGWCRYRLGRMEVALAAFEEALKLSPENADPADALEGVARASARLGRNRVDLTDVADQVLGKPGTLEDQRLGRELRGGPGADASRDPAMVARSGRDYFQVRSAGGPWHSECFGLTEYFA